MTIARDTALEQQVIEAFNAVFKHLGDWSYEDLVAAFRAVHARFAPIVADDPEVALEIRRRTIEGIFSAAQEKHRPIEECEQILGELGTLGFSNLEAKFLELFAYGRHCLDAAAPQVGLRHLEPLLVELEAAASRAHAEPWCREYLALVRPLIDELRVAAGE